MFILLLIILVILISVVGTTYKYGIGPTPTSIKVKNVLLKTLPLNPLGTVYELGAGWGTLAFVLADHYPTNEIIAIEISIIPLVWMHIRQTLFPRKNLKIQYGDFFQKKLLDAGLIVCYLYPGAMKKLEIKIKIECPQTMILTHTFALPNREPARVIFAHDLYNTPIYFYE
jgi:hypothetical protein